MNLIKTLTFINIFVLIFVVYCSIIKNKEIMLIAEIKDKNIQEVAINNALVTIPKATRTGAKMFDLTVAFGWKDSPEGHAYWNDVNSGSI